MLLILQRPSGAKEGLKEENRMEIVVSGKERTVRKGLTVAELIKLAGVENPEYVSVVVNDVFVNQEALDTFELHEGDRVEFLYFMGGGA